MSRHVERRISLALTRRLVRFSVTPNAMTLVSLAIGMAAAPFFLSAAPGLQLTGALLFLLHSILDGCDGEIARLKFLESPGGAALDFWGDNTVHVAVFGCMAVGWSQSAQSALPLALGAFAIAGTLLAAFVVAPHMVGPPAPPARTAGARAADALANRDFIYLIIALSAFGKGSWFIVFVAIGTPIFVLVRLWADRQQTRG
jgi:phosphatidylglycerophosphate synthase